MNGGAHGAEPAPATREEDLIAGLLRLDAVTMAVARHMFEETGGGEAGAVAVRRYLDAEVRARAPWPSGQDYARAAGDLARAGRPAAAEVLRHAAAADRVLEEAEAAWRDRYARRAPLGCEALAGALRRDAGLVSRDPAGPYPGVDGADYQPGGITLGSGTDPVLTVSGRGTQEAVTGWKDFAEMEAWIAGRGTGGSRALTPPPVPAPPRAWLEDLVLARLVNTPSSAPDALPSLRPDTMTTDVRYEVLAAVRTLSATGTGTYTPDMIAAEAARRLSRVPPGELGRYGGPGGPFLRAYVARLAETDGIGRGEFREALEVLCSEDRQARARADSKLAAPGPRGGQAQQREAPAAECLTPGPGPGLPLEHGPGSQAGPVQGQ